MQNTIDKANTPGIGKGNVKRKTKQRAVRKQPKEGTETVEIISGSLLALRLSPIPAIDVFRNQKENFKWLTVPETQIVMESLKLGYDRFVEVAKIEPEVIDTSSGFAGIVMLNHIKQVATTNDHDVSVYEDNGEYKIVIETALDCKHQMHIFFYKDLARMLKGAANRKYLNLLHRCLKTLRNTLGVNMWIDTGDFCEDLFDQEPEISDYDDEEVYWKDLATYRKIEKSYTDGDAVKTFNRIMKVKGLDDELLDRFSDSKHPMVEFARELLEISKMGKRIEEYSYEIDDEMHGCMLEFSYQFWIFFDSDTVYHKQYEYLEALSYEGTQSPTIVTILNEPFEKLPDADDAFPMKMSLFFEKWNDLENQIARMGRLLNILGTEDQEIENRILIHA